MADNTLPLDQLDTAGACIQQAKAIAALAAELPVHGDFPDDALRNSMWAIREILDRAMTALDAHPAATA